LPFLALLAAVGKPSLQEVKDAVKNIRTDESDRVATAMVLGGFCGLLAFCFVIWKVNYFPVFTSMLSNMLSTGGVVLWVIYKQKYIDDNTDFDGSGRKFDFATGFYIRCVSHPTPYHPSGPAPNCGLLWFSLEPVPRLFAPRTLDGTPFLVHRPGLRSTYVPSSLRGTSRSRATSTITW
jgi:hypothetical protein